MTVRPELQRLEAKLRELLLATALGDENASVVLYGYPGVGKSLEELNRDVPVLCVVRLNGDVHREKREGFKSIVQQLCQFMDLPFANHISANRNIKFLKQALGKLHQANRCCVFVLDKFEKLVRESEKQEIVYTLLDALQSKDVRACVIGMTTDFRVKADFDKRVHSRFSHKSWIVPKCREVGPLIASMLQLPDTKKHKTELLQYNKSVQTALNDRCVQAMLKLENGLFGVRSARDIALLAFSSAVAKGEDVRELQSEDLLHALEQHLQSHDSFVFKFVQFPMPHVYTLVACLSLKPGFTYKSVFEKYESFIQTQNTSDVFEAPIMMHAFEDLVHEKFIVRFKERKNSDFLISPHELYRLNVTQGEIRTSVKKHPFKTTALNAFLSTQ